MLTAYSSGMTLISNDSAPSSDSTVPASASRAPESAGGATACVLIHSQYLRFIQFLPLPHHARITNYNSHTASYRPELS